MFIRGGSVNEILRAPEGGGGGGDPDPKNPSGQALYDVDYVRDLRHEAAANRVKAKELEAAAAAAGEVLAKVKKDADEAVARARKEADDAIATLAAAKTDGETLKTAITEAANTRIVQAELKTAAIKAGLIDLDGLKLLDTAKVVLGDDGEVKIPDGFFDEAKKAKPYLFGAPGANTSTAKDAPGAKPPEAKLAKDMTAEERKASLTALGVRA